MTVVPPPNAPLWTPGVSVSATTPEEAAYFHRWSSVCSYDAVNSTFSPSTPRTSRTCSPTGLTGRPLTTSLRVFSLSRGGDDVAGVGTGRYPGDYRCPLWIVVVLDDSGHAGVWVHGQQPQGRLRAFFARPAAIRGLTSGRRRHIRTRHGPIRPRPRCRRGRVRTASPRHSRCRPADSAASWAQWRDGLGR